MLRPEAPLSQREARMPQLDVLRAVAALAVIFAHATAYPGHAAGSYGVTLFFVLSGFLITGILLRCREDRDASRTPALRALRQFYARRSLRIFPLYYLVLLLLIVGGYGPARLDWGWLAGYLGDFCLQYRPPSAVSHLWSLAVEEQFYLIWPWAVLLLPRRSLPPLACALILVGPLYRIWGWSRGLHPGVMWASPFASTEALAVGALLAMVGPSRKFLRFMLVCGVAVLVARMVCRFEFPKGPQPLWSLGHSFIFAWLVGSAARSFSGTAGKVLSFPPLLWTGMISYGIYVYHLLLLTAWKRLGLRTPDWLTFLTVTAATVSVAAISWYTFERPINSLKRHFPYSPRPCPPRSTPGEQSATQSEPVLIAQLAPVKAAPHPGPAGV